LIYELSICQFLVAYDLRLYCRTDLRKSNPAYKHGFFYLT